MPTPTAASFSKTGTGSNTMTKQTNRPRKGDTITTERLGAVVVVKVYPFGTVDVLASNGKHYRITGLGWI